MLQTGLGLVPGYQLVRDWLQLQRRGEAACRRQERGCIKSRPRHRQPRPSRDQREAGDGVTTTAAAAATAQHQQVSSGPGSRRRGATVCVCPAPAPHPLNVPTLSIFSPPNCPVQDTKYYQVQEPFSTVYTQIWSCFYNIDSKHK